MGDVAGVKLKGVLACVLSTSSKCERLDVGLMLGADVKLLVESRVSPLFFVKRPKLSLRWTYFLLLASVTGGR